MPGKHSFLVVIHHLTLRIFLLPLYNDPWTLGGGGLIKKNIDLGLSFVQCLISVPWPIGSFCVICHFLQKETSLMRAEMYDVYGCKSKLLGVCLTLCLFNRVIRVASLGFVTCLATTVTVPGMGFNLWSRPFPTRKWLVALMKLMPLLYQWACPVRSVIVVALSIHNWVQLTVTLLPCSIQSASQN